MTRSFISKRVIFPSGKQKKFILDAKKELGLSHDKLAKILKISSRTLTDWKREKFSMSFAIVKLLSQKLQRNIPTNVKILDRYWYVRKGGKIGGLAVYKKYGLIGGNPQKRKRKWKIWWQEKGRFIDRPIFQRKSINKPKKNVELAEFVGIIMGDGGITKRQLTITLNDKDDKLYSKFVIRLAKKLFGVTPSVYHSPEDSVNNIVISRSELVKFCVEKLGLKIGNKVKQKIDIPDWIKKNKKFQIACLRGLIDTDDSVFTHQYKVNGKNYRYKKLSFTSLSKPLITSVSKILKNNGFKPRLSQNKDVRLDSIENIKKYFQIIGSHNPKHLMRYKN